jgi:hypothetical protein
LKRDASSKDEATDSRHLRRGRLMATVTHVFSIDYVAKLLDEDPQLLQAIVSNGDNLSYGSIISIYTGSDKAITSLTRDGMEELEQMPAARPKNGTTSSEPSSMTRTSSLASMRSGCSGNTPCGLARSRICSPVSITTYRRPGTLAMGGQIVDATIVAAARQRNTDNQKVDIKTGKVTDAWKGRPAKLR